MINRTTSSVPWAAAAVVCCALIALVIVLITKGGLPQRDQPRAMRINCVNNLKQIGLSFRQWALDNADQYPFNVSTNTGGTMEFCARESDGFDRNAALHFLVMSNEMNTPILLVCPKDRSKKPAHDFSSVQGSNVTYRLRSGTNLSEANPKAVLIVCPIDGNILYCDGTVVEANKTGNKDPDSPIHIPLP
jgi:hypothetical protein